MIGSRRKNAFLASNGGRPGATKVMVVVTDGESHDANLRNTVIPACDSQNITRFGIAVSEKREEKRYTVMNSYMGLNIQYI